MFKSIVFFACLAFASARPGLLHGEHIVAAPVVLPSAVSHSSRVDVYSKPIAVVKSAPVVVASPVVAAPVIAAPIVSGHGLDSYDLGGHGLLGHGIGGYEFGGHGIVGHGGLSYATSHSSRYDIHTPAISVGYHGGYGHGW